MKTLFVDHLNFYSSLKILLNRSAYDEIRLISDPKFLSKLWNSILILFGVKIYQENFFLGDIFNSEGESTSSESTRIASLKSFEYSTWLLEQSSLQMDRKIHLEGKKVITLFFSKTVWSEMEYFIMRLLYVKNTYGVKKKYSFLFNKPSLIEIDFLKNTNKEFNLIFCGNISALKLKQTIKFNLKKIYGLKNNLIKKNISKNKKSTVSIATDTIDLESSGRFFPHWFKFKKHRNFYIFNFNKFEVKINQKNKIKNNIKILKDKSILFSLINHRKFDLINKKKLPYILNLHLKSFFALANGLDQLLINLNCDKFIFIDPQDPITDAVQLISKNIGVETRCIQFANTSMIVPLMITLADVYLIFSKHYEKYFSWGKLRPKKFHPIGYTFISKQENSLNKIKKELINDGVKTTIVYFDESVQNNKWGGISKNHNLYNLEFLAKTVLKFKEIAIILKPQFFNNSVSDLNSSIINKAIDSGRFLELRKGKANERNLYTPSNVSQIADYCIGDIIGATAALECALQNKKVLLLNSFGYKTESQKIYNKSDIVFLTLRKAIKAIIDNNSNVGDWSKIITEFVAFNDGKEIDRIEKN